MHRLIECNLQKIRDLCQKYDVKFMYVFGSASTDEFIEASDIDLLIDFRSGISIEKYTDNYFELHYQLEELFNRKVDLVTENSIANPYLKESIDKTKKLLFAS